MVDVQTPEEAPFEPRHSKSVTPTSPVTHLPPGLPVPPVYKISLVPENITHNTSKWTEQWATQLTDPEIHLLFRLYIESVAHYIDGVPRYDHPTDSSNFFFDFSKTKPGSSFNLYAKWNNQSSRSFKHPSEEVLDRRGFENIWSYDIPLLSQYYPHVFYSMLATSALYYSKICPNESSSHFAYRALDLYQQGVSALREDLLLLRPPDSIAALATCFLLATYESIDGNVKRWSRHLLGARDIIRALDVGALAAKAESVFIRMEQTNNYNNFGSEPINLSSAEIMAVQVVDLLWAFQEMEMAQSAVSSCPPAFPLEFYEQIPRRRASNPRITIIDDFFRLFGRVCAFASKDSARKETPKLKRMKSVSPSTNAANELADAVSEWLGLQRDLKAFESRYQRYLEPLPIDYNSSSSASFDYSTGKVPLENTPFGPALKYRTSYDVYLVIYINFMWIMLSRHNPTIPEFGFAAVKRAATDAAPYALRLLRSLPSSELALEYVPKWTPDGKTEGWSEELLRQLPAYSVFGRFVDMNNGEREYFFEGQLRRMFTDMMMPVFFAAVQLVNPNQQAAVIKWLSATTELTQTWSCHQIVRGVKYAWRMNSSDFGTVGNDDLDSESKNAYSSEDEDDDENENEDDISDEILWETVRTACRVKQAKGIF